MIRIFWLSLIFLSFTVSSCSFLKKKALSNYIDQFQDKKAEPVYFEKLPNSYKKQEHPILDFLWWNEKLNTSISYFSSCSKIKKSLDDFQKASYPLQSKRIKSSKTADSLYSILEVSQSGSSKTYMGVYSTQKKNCYFNINLVAGSLVDFKKEEPLFKKFINSFNYK